METDIELGEGQSFVIAGLIDDRVTESLSKVPGLSHIPILGALFKSRSESKSKTELLVMVTPESVYPLAAGTPPLLPKMPKEFLPSSGSELDKSKPAAPGKPTSELQSQPPAEAPKNATSTKSGGN